VSFHLADAINSEPVDPLARPLLEHLADDLDAVREYDVLRALLASAPQ
jgi:hypothetical protein